MTKRQQEHIQLIASFIQGRVSFSAVATSAFEMARKHGYIRGESEQDWRQAKAIVTRTS